MRDRSRTIEALRRLAERPGTPAEGETAHRLLEMMGAVEWNARPFDVAIFRPGATVFYCYWCYRNARGTICKQPPRSRRGQWWMRIKFDHLKQPRWVPVTSLLGCHLSLEPFAGNEEETLYRMDLDWQEHDRAFMARLAALGIFLTPARDREMLEISA